MEQLSNLPLSFLLTPQQQSIFCGLCFTTLRQFVLRNTLKMPQKSAKTSFNFSCHGHNNTKANQGKK